MSEKDLINALCERDAASHTEERRVGVLTDHDLSRIRSVVYGGMTEEEHNSHHSIARDYLEREKVRAAKMEKYKGQFIGGLIIGITGSVGTALYWIGTYFKEHWK